MPTLCLPENLSAAVFMAEYWQKKPLLIRQGLPDIANLLEPDDVFELATYEDVTARLITQDDENANNWQLKLSPLSENDLENTPKLWTLLVQNLEQWSIDIAELWSRFSYLPQWQQDDIMVSFAPKGGSVGKHYDQYDVFLAQGYGKRHWQLGKFCDTDTPFVPNQPLRLLDDMGEIIFDEVLEPGDVLYVPPGLSHYGVAVDDCLTFSFGLRRPSMTDILDKAVDCATQTHGELTNNTIWKDPLPEIDLPRLVKDAAANAGAIVTHRQAHNAEVTPDTLAAIKAHVLNQLSKSTLLDKAILSTLCERRFELVEDEDSISPEELRSLLSGMLLSKEPASKLLYAYHTHAGEESNDSTTCHFYSGGEEILGLSDTQKKLLQLLADGHTLSYEQLEKTMTVDEACLENLCDWLDAGYISLL